MQIKCLSPGSNRGPLVCETSVITNYTTQTIFQVMTAKYEIFLNSQTIPHPLQFPIFFSVNSGISRVKFGRSMKFKLLKSFPASSILCHLFHQVGKKSSFNSSKTQWYNELAGLDYKARTNLLLFRGFITINF